MTDWSSEPRQQKKEQAQQDEDDHKYGTLPTTAPTTLHPPPAASQSVKDLIHNLRNDYKSDVLLESTVSRDPFHQFEVWLQRAKDNNFFEPHGMMLCTVSKEGEPSARIVLLRQFDARGFVFYTNYNSRKAQQIQANPNVAATFWWHESSVRIEGTAEKVSAQESDAYFASRPRNSQLGAWASNQSSVLPDRQTLEAKVVEIATQFPETVPRPEWWGGFRIVPRTIEFWQGRPSRLHDRLRFTRDTTNADQWVIQRLAP